MCEFCDSYNSNYNSQRVWIEPQPKPILVCDSCRWTFPFAEELVGGLCSACQPKLPLWVGKQINGMVRDLKWGVVVAWRVMKWMPYNGAGYEALVKVRVCEDERFLEPIDRMTTCFVLDRRKAERRRS